MDKNKHILLVDDDVTFLKMLQGWLNEKYKITAVKSGMQAIAYMKNHKPDLVLLDYNMPETDGPQVMEMMKNEPETAEIPIVFLTGKSDRESIEAVMRLEPQGYLLKAMSRETMVAAVDSYFQTGEWKSI